MKKNAKKLLLPGILCLVLTGALWLFHTQSGLEQALAMAEPFFEGELTYEAVEGTLAGPITFTHLTVTSHDQSLKANRLTVNWSPLALLTGDLKVDQVSGKGIEVISPSLEGALTFASLEGGAEGHFLGKTYRVTLKQATGSLRGKALQAKGSVTLKNFMVNQSDFKVQLGDSFLTIKGGLQAKTPLHFFADIKNLQDFLPNGFGRIHGEGTLSFRGQYPIIKGKVYASELGIQSLRMNQLNAQFNFDGTAQAQTLNITVKALKTDSLHGKNITLQGKLTKQGFQLTQGDIEFPEWGTALTHTQFTAKASHFGTYQFTGKTESETGPLTLTGSFSWKTLLPKTILHIKSQNFTLVNNQDFLIQLNNNFTVKQNGLSVDATGTITIPKGRITPQLSADIPTLPSDVVILDSQHKPEKPDLNQTPWQFSANLAVILGKAVIIDTKGIQGDLMGRLQIHVDPNRTTTASGKIQVTDGTYRAHGQRLVIKAGELFYTDTDLMDPGLNILAVRQIATYLSDAKVSDDALEVGVKVQGTLNHPTVSLYSSTPALSHEDILSYLLMGRPLSQLGKNDGDMILQTASAINLGLGELTGLQAQLKKVGIDYLGIESARVVDSDTQAIVESPTLVLGKKISKRLSVASSVGILEELYALKIRYQLNKHWTLQSNAGTNDSGFDLVYTLDK